MKCYTTDHWISRIVMAAFAEGCDGQVVQTKDLLPGDAAAYGILRGTEKILQTAHEMKRTYYAIDHGYVNPSRHTENDFSGYYRVTKNGRQFTDFKFDKPDDRWKALDKDIRPWKRSGEKILIIPMTDPVANYYGSNTDAWLRSVMLTLAEYTKRPLFLRTKDDKTPISDVLKDTWCVVTHSSNVAVDALLEGVPVMTLGESAAEPLSWGWHNIENPVWPDREAWAYELAYNQFTLDEMRTGRMWEIMNG